MRKRYFLYAALGMLIGGLAVGGLWFWTQRLSQPRWWEEALLETLGQDVSIEGAVETHFILSPSIDLSSVRFADGFWVPRLEVHFDPLAILEGKSEVSGLTFHGFRGSINPSAFHLSAFDALPSRDFPVLTFVEGTLALGGAETVKISKATLRPGRGDAALNAEGTALWQGRALRFSAALGKKSKTNETRTLAFSLSSTLGRFRFSGEIDPRVRAQGRAELKMASLVPLWEWVESDTDVPSVLKQEAQLEGDLTISSRDIRWENLRVQSGAFLAEGGVKLAFEDGVKVALEGSIPYLNLGGTASRKVFREEEWRRLFRLPALPDSLDVDFIFRISSLGLEQGVVQDIRFGGSYAQDALRFHTLSAVLPGATSLSALGTLRPDRFDVVVEAASDDVRLLLEWGGVDTSSFPPGRLHHLWMRGGIRATPSEISLFPFTMEIDAVHIDAGATIVPASRPAFGLSFAVDALPLDIYSPSLATGDKVWNEMRSVVPDVDFNIKGSVGTLSQEALSVDDVSLSLSALDGTFRWNASAGSDEAETLFHTEGELVFLADGRTEIKGSRLLGRLPTPFGPFLKTPVSLPLLDSSLGPFVFSLEAEGWADLTDLKMSGELDGLQIRGQGQLRREGVPSLRATLSATHASLPRVVDLLGLSWPEGGVGGFALSTHLESDFSQAFLSDLRLRLGPVNLAGKADIRRGDETTPPRLSTSLYAANVPLDLFAPADRAHSVVPLRDWIGAPPAHVPHGQGALSVRGEPVFEVPFSPDLSLDITLDAEHLSFGGIHIPAPHLVFRSEAARASLDLSSRAFFGGQADASMMAVKQPDAIVLDGRASVLGLNMPRIDPAASRPFFQEGTMDLSFSFTGRGASLAQALKTLAGSGQARFADVVLEGIDFSALKREGRDRNGVPSFERLFSGNGRLSLLDVSLTSAGSLVEAEAFLSCDEGCRGVWSGMLDAEKRTLDAVLALHLFDDETAPPVRLVWSGSWTKPLRRVETQEFETWYENRRSEEGRITERGRP